MIANDGKRSMGEEFGWPFRAHGRAKLPGQRRSIGPDPRIAALPFGLGVPDKPVGALVEHVIGDADFGWDILAVGPVVAHD